MFVSSQNSYVEAVTTHVTILGDRAFGRWWGRIRAWGWSTHDGISALTRKETRELAQAFLLFFPSPPSTAMCAHSKEAVVWEPGIDLSPETDRQAPCYQTSSLQNCDKITTCWLSHHIYGILWQPKQVKTFPVIVSPSDACPPFMKIIRAQKYTWALAIFDYSLSFSTEKELCFFLQGNVQ